MAGGETIATIPAASSGKPVDVPIPERLARESFVGIRFAADQAMVRGDACFDNDTPAVWTHLGPGTSLEAAGTGRAGIGGVWQGLAGRVTIGLASTPPPADLAAALILAVALTERGARPVIVDTNDPAAAIVIGRGPVPLALQPPARPEAPPVLRVASPEAARALVAASPVLVPFTTVDAAGKAAPPADTPPGSISLAAMGQHPPTVVIAGTASVRFELPFDQLPSGQHPVAVQLFGRGASLPANETLIASVIAGGSGAGQLVWSRTFHGDIDLDGDIVPIPRGVLRNRLPVTLQLVRAGGRTACETGPVPTQNFGGFAIPRDRAALVRIDAPPATVPPFVPLMARILASAGARPGAIEVAAPGTPLDRPFLTVGFTPPTEIAETVPVRPDQGHVVLMRPSAGVRVELSGADAMSIVQVVHTGSGVSGIWLSPGASTPPEQVPVLSAGNVVIFPAPGAEPAVFDTLAPDVVVEIPRSGPLDTLLRRWRTELFVLAWIVVTLAAIAIVIRIRRPTSRP